MEPEPQKKEDIDPKQELIDRLLNQFGEVDEYPLTWEDALGETKEAVIYLRPIERAQLEYLLAQISAQKPLLQVYQTVIMQLIVHPSIEEAYKLFENYPGLLGTLGTELQKGTGFNAETQKKRLTSSKKTR